MIKFLKKHSPCKTTVNHFACVLPSKLEMLRTQKKTRRFCFSEGKKLKLETEKNNFFFLGGNRTKVGKEKVTFCNNSIKNLAINTKEKYNSEASKVSFRLKVL